jgi:hypothetical protein
MPLDPLVLFFFLGLAATLVQVSLRLPESVSQFLAFYLLLALGMKGGSSLSAAPSSDFFLVALLGIASCLLIAGITFAWAKRSLSLADGAALAASYGSVSAVTFIVAQGQIPAPQSSYMVAVMAVMEMPAIALALYFYQKSLPTRGNWVRAAFGHKSVALLLGGFFLGAIQTPEQAQTLKPVMVDAFRGVLALYLIDLGAAAAKDLFASLNWRALVTAIFLPLTYGTTTLLSAWALGISHGNAVLLGVLAGSASYIAAPAAIRLSVPEASPGYYATYPLAFTFTFNLTLGIPLYLLFGNFLFAPR